MALFCGVSLSASAPPLFRDTRPGSGLARGCSLRL